MANPKHLEILKQGVDVWNDWRSRTNERVDLREAELSGQNLAYARLSHASLSGSNLFGAILKRTDLSEANLINANLGMATFSGADLSGADLSRANLSDANLVAADFTGADVSNADLTRANLMGAKLTECILRETNLHNAILSKATILDADLNDTNLAAVNLGYTTFAAVDLSTTQGLESANHHSPSTIGIDTLYKSRGQIPEVFLRGCGVPDSFITQARALIGAEEGIQFYSCFISYSGLDDEFARRLHGRLQQEHVRVWFAPHDIQGGKKLHEQIDEAIRVYDKLLILLSPNSLQSEWVMTELRKARKAERKTGKRKLFPVGLVNYPTLREWECFDADGGKDLAVEVREYFIPDFSNWKDHDAFEKGFARLLKDLRAEGKAAG